MITKMINHYYYNNYNYYYYHIINTIIIPEQTGRGAPTGSRRGTPK